MQLSKKIFFLIIVSYFHVSLANVEANVGIKAALKENVNLNSSSNPRMLNRNEGIFYGDKYKIEGINFSALIMGELIASNIDQNQSSRFAKKTTYSTFCVPRILLYTGANLNEYVTANIGLNFAPSPGACSACGYGGKNDPSRFNKYDKIDQAHILFYNSELSPYYAKIGIQYYNYGHYSPNSIPATLTQLMTQIQAPGVTLGYMPANDGLNFSVFSFTDKVKKDKTSKINNIGAQVGYINNDDLGKSEISLDFLSNIASSVNYIVSSNQCPSVINPLNSSYKKAVPGISLTLKKQINDFYTTLGLTTALTSFNKEDIAWKEKGAKPAALLLDLNYKFISSGDKQNLIGFNYQKSLQAVNIKGNNLGRGLPLQRIQTYYTIELMKNIEVGVQISWDKDYAVKNKGTGKDSLTSLVTLMAKIM